MPDLDSKSTINGFEKIGQSIHLLNIPDIKEFISFYQSITLKKGPLFDSSMNQHSSAQWSFFSLKPNHTFTKMPDNLLEFSSENEKSTSQECFFEQLDKFSFKPKNNYLELKKYPFIGGYIGYLSFENFIENRIEQKVKKNSFPLYQFSFFTNVFIFDHAAKETVLISDGDATLLELFNLWQKTKTNANINKRKNKTVLKPNITKEKYLSTIEKIFEHIRNGDIYQANFTHKFSSEFTGNPFSLYQSLRNTNPAPFACFYPINEKQYILCSSPERLFKVCDGQITSNPIKGTIRRDPDNFIDEKLKKDLLNSAKDAAELAMIVDLIRNDIGKISEFGSVKVLHYKKLETFQKVHHLVGIIEGKLRPEITVKNIFEALFPGGSITGAPKIRSIEILNELEDEARGPYTGSVGYIDIRGNMDFNIMIRTILIDSKSISLQVGGGIVIDSNPYCEYEETLHKAEAMFDAL